MATLTVATCCILAALLWALYAKNRQKREREADALYLGRKSIRLYHVNGVSETNNLSVSSYHGSNGETDSCFIICCPQLFKKTVPMTPKDDALEISYDNKEEKQSMMDIEDGSGHRTGARTGPGYHNLNNNDAYYNAHYTMN